MNSSVPPNHNLENNLFFFNLRSVLRTDYTVLMNFHEKSNLEPREKAH